MMIHSIVDFFKQIWAELVKFCKIVFKAILKFTENVVSFFKSPKRWAILKANKNKLLPIVLKQKLKNGHYNVIEGIFDEEKDDMVDIEKETQGIECERLDSELNGYFGDKDLVILRN